MSPQILQTEKMVVEMNELGKRYESSWVLCRLSLKIRQGESVALFGKNGSGKSTLLKMIATLLAPTIGTIKVAGHDSRKEKGAIRSRIRYLAHEKQLYETLTVMENLRLTASLRQITSDLILILDRMGIAKYKNQKISKLSEGTRKRLTLARLLLGESDLILLDEPHPTLDTNGREILNTMIYQWKKEGKTILLASHDHKEALSHADRLIILEGGTVSYDGKPK